MTRLSKAEMQTKQNSKEQEIHPEFQKLLDLGTESKDLVKGVRVTIPTTPSVWIDLR